MNVKCVGCGLAIEWNAADEAWFCPEGHPRMVLICSESENGAKPHRPMFYLPTTEVAVIDTLRPEEGESFAPFYVVAWWGSEADARADIEEAGDWAERSTASVVVDTMEEALAEIGVAR